MHINKIIIPIYLIILLIEYHYFTTISAMNFTTLDVDDLGESLHICQRDFNICEQYHDNCKIDFFKCLVYHNDHS